MRETDPDLIEILLESAEQGVAPAQKKAWLLL